MLPKNKIKTYLHQIVGLVLFGRLISACMIENPEIVMLDIFRMNNVRRETSCLSS